MKEVTKRRQKQINKKEEEKKLIALWKKKWRLTIASRFKEKVLLPKPIRSGYIRYFVLREDIAKSREAHVYKTLLKHINYAQHCKDKKFLRKDYKTKKMVPMNQDLNYIDHKTWNELNLSAKHKSFFEMIWKPNVDHRGRMLKGGRYVFVFNKPWMFVKKIQPFYITHVYKINPQLESELMEISNKIEKNNLGPRIAKATGMEWSYRDWNNIRAKLEEEFYDKLIKEVNYDESKYD